MCRGDPSDEFRFATFFPAAVHPVIDKIAGLCSKISRVGLQQAAARTESGSSYVLDSAPLPGSDNAEAARRRYLHCMRTYSHAGSKRTQHQ